PKITRSGRVAGEGMGRGEPLIARDPQSTSTEEAPMSATIVETLDLTVCTTESKSSPARAQASRANGRRSQGPITPEGKANSRRTGCRDGLTGKGIVLPEAAAAEVARREADFARDFRPRDAVECELVRQMALGSWRSRELGIRIIEHDARVNASRF